MIVAAGIDWTMVILTSIITAPAILSAVLAFLIHRAVQTPSGSKIGEVMELTHDLSAADVALTTAVHERVVNGHPAPPAARAAGSMTRRGD